MDGCFMKKDDFIQTLASPSFPKQIISAWRLLVVNVVLSIWHGYCSSFHVFKYLSNLASFSNFHHDLKKLCNIDCVLEDSKKDKLTCFFIWQSTTRITPHSKKSKFPGPCGKFVTLFVKQKSTGIHYFWLQSNDESNIIMGK